MQTIGGEDMIVKTIVSAVTPVYTGDAFNINAIKSQTIMGSLRFWFEVFLKAIGQLPKNYNFNTENLNTSKYNDKVLMNVSKANSLYEAKVKSYEEIALPSRIFGCTGLNSKIAIKNIVHIGASDYLSLRRISPIKVGGSKRGWHFPPVYFFGDFTIEFFIEDESIFKDIFCPLLNFIEEYGYLGGKNNLGFGRVKFVLEGKDYGDIKKYNVFKLARYGCSFIDVDISKAVKEYNSVEDMYYIPQIGLHKKKDPKQYSNINYFAELIKELIEEKDSLRRNFRGNARLRHYIFGFTGKNEDESVNATKIIPWINKIGSNKYEYGFISLTFLDENMIRKEGVPGE